MLDIYDCTPRCVVTNRVKHPLMDYCKSILKGLLSEADGTPRLHMKLQQLLNLCNIKAFPLAADSI